MPQPDTGAVTRGPLNRRSLLRGIAGTSASVAEALRSAPGYVGEVSGIVGPGNIDLERVTIPELQDAMRRGRLTSRQLTRCYLRRIRQLDPDLQAVVLVNPRARQEALESDRRRRQGRWLGPLEGIPVLLKDNIGTAEMPTTAGSLALCNATGPDAFIVERLKAAGAVLLGKANLSEWANFRSTQATSGWSAIRGQTNNPYVLDRNPCGSSSGSAVAVAASLTTIALGTETNGSIVCPAGHNSTVGIKPTVGLASRSGIIPISHRQDTAGPIARNVTDAAIALGALTGGDSDDPATGESGEHAFRDYARFLDREALRDARIGVWRQGHTGISPETDLIFDQALEGLARGGAILVDPANPPGSGEIGGLAFTAMLYEFKHDLNAYLAGLRGQHPRDLAGLIEFNARHRRQEMAYFGQEIFTRAQRTSGDLSDPEYAGVRGRVTSLARQAIDDTLEAYDLDAIVAPTNSPAWPTDLINGDHFLLGSSTPSAAAGYPNLTVPAGFSHGLPIGISLLASRWEEPKLVAYAYAFEQITRARRAPGFLPATPMRTDRARR